MPTPEVPYMRVGGTPTSGNPSFRPQKPSLFTSPSVSASQTSIHSNASQLATPAWLAKATKSKPANGVSSSALDSDDEFDKLLDSDL